jgi:cysteine desulfurase/selenocysteine lyase
MTTPLSIPTSDHPVGVPDEGTLARLASDILQSLQGFAQGGGAPVPAPHEPAALTPTALDLRSRDPGTGAAVAPSLGGAPPPAAPAALAPRPGLPREPRLPDEPSGRPGAAATSYYFLADPRAGHGATLSSPDDRVHAQPFALPGEAALRSTLSSITLSSPNHAEAGQPSDRYVLDPNRVALSPRSGFDVEAIRRDFPILSERVNGRQLVWLDNAATTQKPQAVIDRLSHFYRHENSNIHRAAHELAARATDAYEGARDKTARFLGAASSDEIIFVRGATEAINLVANTWGKQNLGVGDEIVVSHLEHHANIVPWQMIAAATGARLRVIPVDDDGQILFPDYLKLLSPRTKIVSVTQVSNALGTIMPVQAIAAAAHAVGAKVLIDGAQAVSHMRVNVQAIDADFYVFSGHKVFAPTGIGVVYGKKAILDELPPWQGGGNMIADVAFEHTTFHGPPTRFEAGTGNIADAVGLGAAIDYVEGIGLERIAQYEHDLLVYATHGLRTVPGLRLIGTAAEKASVLSFVLDGHEPEAVGRALNEEGIAVRSGHHCAQPILRRFGLEATVRPSLAFYNTCSEVDRLVSVLKGIAGRSRR